MEHFPYWSSEEDFLTALARAMQDSGMAESEAVAALAEAEQASLTRQDASDRFWRVRWMTLTADERADFLAAFVRLWELVERQRPR